MFKIFVLTFFIVERLILHSKNIFIRKVFFTKVFRV